MTTEIEFITPLLVAIELEEFDDHAELVRVWREKFYRGWYKELWERVEKNQHSQPVRWARFVLHLLWPIVTLAILANVVTGASILFLSLVLIPAQVIILAWFLFKLFIGMCMGAAFKIEDDLCEVAE